MRPTHYRSKTIATWLAVLLGTLGLHRLYLHGLNDVKAWLHPLPTALGLWGVHRLRTVGQDDPSAWLLLPLLGLMISMAMLFAILYALTPDQEWDELHNPGHTVTVTGWGPVVGAIVALLIGGAALMGTAAYGGQKFFEWQLAGAQQPGRR